VNHNYDTCWLKLHLRDVAHQELAPPENELLKHEYIFPFTQKYGLLNFELDWVPVSLPTNKLFVGFELIRCGCSESSAPSFFFMGNQEGRNYYKETGKEEWKSGGDYTIYINMRLQTE